MPSRNVVKKPAPNSYYHVYARGNNKQKIFNSVADYKYFISLIERYLSQSQIMSEEKHIYPNYFKQVEILTYCLKPNHFHFLVYQKNSIDLEHFMRSLMTSYSMYFNLKYVRTGPVFDSRYKSSKIDNNDYLQHVSRYIHLNPRRWENYGYSSLKYYRFGDEPIWLNTEKILEQFASRESYIDFVSENEEMHNQLNILKHQLADK